MPISDHPHHPVAIRWLDEAQDACALGQGLALLPMVTAGFLRLVTHPRVFVEPTPLAVPRQPPTLTRWRDQFHPPIPSAQSISPVHQPE